MANRLAERSVRRGLVLALAVVALAAAALWYLTAPPKGEDGYRERAASSAETLRSQLQVARLWVEAVEGGDSTRPAAAVGLEEAESDARAASERFEGYEPPSRLLGLRAEYASLAGAATNALSALRIASQQEEWERLGELSRPLTGIADRLEEFEERAEP